MPKILHCGSVFFEKTHITQGMQDLISAGAAWPPCSSLHLSYCTRPSSTTSGPFGHTPSCGLSGWRIRGWRNLRYDVNGDIPAVELSGRGFQNLGRLEHGA